MKKKIIIRALALLFGAIILAATSLLAHRGQAKHVETSSTGHTIYVDWRGAERYNDGRYIHEADGSSIYPYTTVTRGYSAASDGDTLIIRAGTYPEDVTFSKAVTVKEEGGAVRIGKSALSVKLERSLMMGTGDTPDMDQDHDCLVDSLENALADAFRPYCIFDSDEIARLSNEPVTLFQVRPLDIQANNVRIKMKWVFLFGWDGGYGPSSVCFNSHFGDNDDAFYELTSNDTGVTWALVLVGLSNKGLEWPTNSRLGVYEPYDTPHPAIYMSASKHHEYFTRDRDHQNSIYSKYGCNDDVNGQGDRVLVLLRRTLQSSFYNNVGEPEPENHPSPTFVNDLRDFPGKTAWEGERFYECDPISWKWMTHAFICNR